MIRLFPKFWKLNSNSHRWTIVLSMAADLRNSVVGSLPWVWHLYLEYCYQAKYWFSLSCYTQSNSQERSKLCIIQMKQLNAWLNKDQKSWDVGIESDSTFRFLRTSHSLCLRSSTYICPSLWNWLCPWDDVLSQCLEQKINYLELVQLTTVILHLL